VVASSSTPSSPASPLPRARRPGPYERTGVPPAALCFFINQRRGTTNEREERLDGNDGMKAQVWFW
jgi:hypothetical protein